MSQSKFELPGAHGEATLIPRRRHSGRLGLTIRFLFAEKPIRSSREMPRYGADSLRMALPPCDALVETTDVPLRVAPAPHTVRVGGFTEGPLEVAVDVRAEPTETRLAAAGVDAGRRAGIGGQFLGGGETRDVAYLER